MSCLKVLDHGQARVHSEVMHNDATTVRLATPHRARVGLFNDGVAPVTLYTANATGQVSKRVVGFIVRTALGGTAGQHGYRVLMTTRASAVAPLLVDLMAAQQAAVRWALEDAARADGEVAQ